jgi:hypothetical protein
LKTEESHENILLEQQMIRIKFKPRTFQIQINTNELSSPTPKKIIQNFDEETSLKAVTLKAEKIGGNVNTGIYL